ncbi:hypothetical protein DUI87_11301 [Hirundo rustica rustica]|uniref:ribonuclease H n=1 Tax=Hirundo rustica rustica TaxID=333673 RepID=A0A3M0KGI0_HIRRU|nr:hypothetical protein DUI87_11301 [Hirundo rustica rustica]
MMEATASNQGRLETYPVPHATAWNTILGLEKQVLWRHGTPERIESDNGTHFTNSLINTWAKEHGIEWVYHIPYHVPATGKVERCNGLLKIIIIFYSLMKEVVVEYVDVSDEIQKNIFSRAAVGEAIILHYMDDVLVCAPNDDLLSHTLDLTIDSLVAAGFELQEEKIQRMPPWKYLGLEIGRVVLEKFHVAKKGLNPPGPACGPCCMRLKKHKAVLIEEAGCHGDGALGIPKQFTCIMSVVAAPNIPKSESITVVKIKYTFISFDIIDIIDIIE